MADAAGPTPGGLVRSRFLFSSDLRWAATLPVGRPVSFRMSLRESREPKLSLRPADDEEEALVVVLLVVLLLLLPVFLMYTFDVVEEVPPPARSRCSFCCCCCEVTVVVLLELLEFVVVMWLVVLLAVLLMFPMFPIFRCDCGCVVVTGGSLMGATAKR